MLSHTAAYIAIKFYGLTLNPKLGQKFDPAILKFYQKMVKYLPKHLSWNSKALASPFWRNFFVWWEELLLPGDLMHIVSRKYYIDQIIKQSLTEGYSQLVVLGSGLDHLGSFWSNKKIHCFEIDTPAMISSKCSFLENEGCINSALHLCALDVTQQSLQEVLGNHPDFDQNKSTLFIAEGFFDYLSLYDAKNVLNEIKEFCPDHKLISTLFSLDDLNIFHRSMFTSGVALVGESIKLPLNRKGFEDVLIEKEYQIAQQISYKEMEQDLVKKCGLNLSVMKGFYIMCSLFGNGTSTNK